MKLVWSAHALADRDHIFDHIENESSLSAARVDNAIEAQAGQLTRFPNSGRTGRIIDSRELVISGLPYIIAYKVLTDRVRILRVLHSAQQWPDSLPE